jgi:hypothetical protein
LLKNNEKKADEEKGRKKAFAQVKICRGLAQKRRGHKKSEDGGGNEIKK